MPDVAMHVIAHVKSDFPSKFGIPRQSGLVPELTAHVVFCPEYRDVHALRGLAGFSHIWLLWHFSANADAGFRPTVRPPRLGGNERLGVFATRSPFRPNAIGLSCVELLGIEDTVLHIAGADLMDGTPIFDIKPYLPYADAFPNARGGFAPAPKQDLLLVQDAGQLTASLPAQKRAALFAALAQDPRPAYQNDAARVYGFSFAGHEIRFCVEGQVLNICGMD